MSRIAILGPTNLLGKELRGLLGGRRERFDAVALLTSEDEEVGTVTEVAGRPALVARASVEELAEVDLVFACGEPEGDLAILAERREGATGILLSPRASAADGRPVIAGIDPSDAAAGEILVSPHPAAIALAYQLAPLAPLGVTGAAATVVQPVSMFGEQGLDDLLDQTRDLLAMTGERRPSVFERQLAFNLYPAPEGSGGLAELVRRTTGVESPIAVQAMQGAVFHGFASSLFVTFAEDPGLEAVREALAGQRHVTLFEEEDGVAELPGLIDSAARDDLLVGRVHADPGYPGGYWLWAVLDNLTRGGALNAMEVAEAVLGR
jgi:aspartate-semialdehyde dehydrogenase